MAPPASPDARVATGRTYKAEGNDAFARGELAAALRAYHYAGLVRRVGALGRRSHSTSRDSTRT